MSGTRMRSSALSHAWAFVRRDLLQQASYAGANLLRGFSIVILLFVFRFVGELVDAGPTRLAGGYFTFFVAGMGLASLLTLGIRGFAQELREGQLAGTLDVLFLSPVPPWELALWGSLWSMCRNLATLAAYLAFGSLLGFGHLRPAWGAMMVVAVVSVVAFAPLGVLAATYVILWKKGEPVSFAVGAASSLVAGVYFPLRLLPHWMQIVAQCFPLTHSVRAFRSAFIGGQGVAAIASSLGILAAFGLVLGPISLLLFDRAVAWAKKTGSLAQY